MKVYFILILLSILSLPSIPVKAESNYFEFYLASTVYETSSSIYGESSSLYPTYRTNDKQRTDLESIILKEQDTMIWRCDDDDAACWEREYPDVIW